MLQEQLSSDMLTLCPVIAGSSNLSYTQYLVTKGLVLLLHALSDIVPVLEMCTILHTPILLLNIKLS